MRLEYFQLIDRIVEIDTTARRITSEAVVPAESTIFEGHFPGYPLLPGVLMIEAMAQTGGWLVVAANKYERMAFLATVKEAKFRHFVTPGQLMTLSAELVHEGSGFAVLETRGTVNGKPICNATLTLRVMNFPTPQVREQMMQVADRIGLSSEAFANG